MKVVDVLDYSGSYYKIGLEHGRILRNSNHFQHMLSKIKRIGNLDQDTREIRNKLTYFCPPLLDELKGLQEGMKYTEVDTLRLFGGYDMPLLEMGCTSFVTSDFYVRNYDFSPDIYDSTFIIQKHSEVNWVCGNSELILGRLDGMNNNGLTCGLHFVNNDSYSKGFLGSTIVRIVLEMCKNVGEAVDLLKELPHAASYNYSLVDRNGSFAVFEASPVSHNVLREKSSLSCVNMFQTDIMKPHNQPNIDSSLDRLEALSHLSKTIKPVREVHKWFSAQTSPIFYTNYENFFGTLHTVSYMPKTSQILLTSPGGEAQQFSM